MGRLLHSINSTLNGSCHHEDVVADQEHHAYATEVLKAAEAVLLGRNTFDLFASFWPQAADRKELPAPIREFAVELTDKPKWVMTSRELASTWKNSIVLRGPSLDAVRNKLREVQGTVVVFGSPSLATALAAEGLVAELHVLVQPILVDGASRIYAGYPDRSRLALRNVEQFKSGVVLLRYQVTPAVAGDGLQRPEVA